MLLVSVEKALPAGMTPEVRNEVRQRLVLGVLDGTVPVECASEAAIKFRRQVELAEAGLSHVQVQDFLVIEPDFAPELIDDITKCEEEVNIPFANWAADLQVIAAEPAPLPPKAKVYHHPAPKRGAKQQNTKRKLQTAWRYAA